MTKNAKPANGEAMPVSRRHLLGAALAGTAISAAAFVPAGLGITSSAEPVDPIIDAIDAFYRGSAAFGQIKEDEWPALGGEGAVVHATYGAPLIALQAWSQPAVSRVGAIKALRFAHNEAAELGAEPTVIAMLAAALAHLDAENA